VDPDPAVAAPSVPRGAELALGLAGFCAFLNVYAAQPLLPLLQAAFGAPKAAAALTVSAPNLAVALAAPLVGAWAARRRLHRVITGALFLLAVPTLLAATAGSLPTLVAWRFAQGLAVPGVYAVGVTYAAAVWPPRELGRAMAALVTGNVLGGFCGRMLAGAMAEHVGWRAAFVALGLLTLCGATAVTRLLPPVRRSAGPATPAGGPAVTGAAPARPRPRLDAALLATFAVGFSVLFTQVATFTYAVYHLAGPRFGLGATGLSSVFVVYLFGAFCTPLAGRWIGRIGSRRVLALSTAGGLLGTALLLVPWLPAVIAGLALSCSAAFVNQSAATSYLPGAAGPERRALASGVYISSYYLGGAIGGVLPAAAWAAAGWPGCVAMVALAQLGTLAMALRWWSPAVAPGGPVPIDAEAAGG
jgi:predicted MFS family arabinose efflux permease